MEQYPPLERVRGVNRMNNQNIVPMSFEAVEVTSTTKPKEVEPNLWMW